MIVFQPKAGDPVYTIDGHHGEYVGPNPGGGHAIALLYEEFSGDGERCWTGHSLTSVPEVFSAPPKPKLDAETAERQAKLEKVRAELAELNSKKWQTEREISTLEKDHAALVTRLTKRTRVLQRIEDLLDGKFTHFVEESGYGWDRLYNVRILSDAKLGDRYDKAIRLFMLYGRSNGDLEWRLGEYSDISGNSRRVHPAQSEEEAKQIVRDLCMARCDELRTQKGTSGYESLKKSLEAIGGEFPADMEEELKRAAEAAAAKAVQAAEKALEEAKRKAGGKEDA